MSVGSHESKARFSDETESHKQVKLIRDNHSMTNDSIDDMESPIYFDRAIHDIAVVHNQLKKHSERLKTWDEALRKREWITDQIIRDSDVRINAEVERRFKRGKEQYEKEIKLLESQVKEKVTEIQRLQSSFQNIRESYNKVKVEKTHFQETCQELQRKNQALESRLKNLKKIVPKSDHSITDEQDKNRSKCEHVTKDDNKEKEGLDIRTQCASSVKKKTVIKAADVFKGPVLTSLKELLNWFYETELQFIIDSPLRSNTLPADQVEKMQTKALDRCLILLPKITDLLHLHLDKRSSLQLEDALCHCLKFLHFSFLLIDRSEGAQKQRVASSIHRLGEAIHKEYLVSMDEDESTKIYLKDEARMCASFVVLHTVKQVDILLNSWKTIKSLASSVSGRQLFIRLRGHIFILFLLANQDYNFLTHQLSRAVDVLLCMCVDQNSSEMMEVRDVVATHQFIKALYSLVNAPESVVSIQIKEKLIVLFQQAIKRHLDESTWRMISEHKLQQALQKEVSCCQSDVHLKNSSYEFILKATIGLLAPYASKSKS